MESTLKIICRLCLGSKGYMEAIFNNNTLLEKIKEFTTIEIENIDGIPKFICISCKLKIINALEFKTECIRTNDILVKKYRESHKLYENSTIKIESDIEDLQSNDEILNNELYVNKKDRKRKNNTKHHKKTKTEEITVDLLKIEEGIELINDVNPLNIEDDLRTYEIETKEKKRSGGGCGGNSIKTMCQICGKMLFDIKQHMTTHTGEKNYKCPHCNKGFSQSGKLKNHINIHTGVKPYKCTLCEKAFADPTSLKSHMVTHTGERKYRCDICDKSFGYSHTLSTHKKIHMQDKKHNCTYCNRPFLSREGLKKHIRIHTGEKPYKCKFCTKNFTTSWNLKTHLRVHTKERPYKCTICELDFTYRSVLTAHMRKIHNSLL